MSETNGVVNWWKRLGAVCAAILALIALAGVLQRFALASVDRQFTTLGSKVDRLSEVVNLAATAVSDPDSTERSDAIRSLRRLRRVIP